jgi:hypothetical protein
MRSRILASVALAALLSAPAFAQSSSSGSSAAPAQSESKSDSAAPATGSAAGSSATTPSASGTTSGSSATTSGSKSSEAAKPTAPAGAVIATQEQSQLTADDLIGTEVRNPQDEKVGKIEDLVLDSDMKVVGVVVSVGGFLGMGKHDVALTREQVKISTKGDEQVATVSMTKDQLKAAPEFKTLEQQKAEADQERAKASQGTAAGSGARPTTPPPAKAQ